LYTTLDLKEPLLLKKVPSHLHVLQ
jgi:hypothetical protein